MSATTHHPPATGHHPPATGHRPPPTGHRPPPTGHRPPATGHRPPATTHRPPATTHHPTGTHPAPHGDSGVGDHAPLQRQTPTADARIQAVAHVYAAEAGAVLGDHVEPVPSLMARSSAPIATNADSTSEYSRNSGTAAMSFIMVCTACTRMRACVASQPGCTCASRLTQSSM